MTIRRYGWIPDRPDPRDYTWRAPAATAPVPAYVDLRPEFAPVPVEDQGAIGSCTANALCGIMELLYVREHRRHLDFSRLFLYYETREAEGTTHEDAGAQIRTAVKTLAAKGVCPESLWQYRPANLYLTPCGSCYAIAAENRALRYQRVRGLLALKAAIAARHPVAFGFQVYSSAESREARTTGRIPVPSRGWFRSEEHLGGHAVLAVGYDDAKRAVIFRNSWGAAWGDRGYGYLPYEFILSPTLTADFWLVSDAAFRPEPTP